MLNGAPGPTASGPATMNDDSSSRSRGGWRPTREASSPTLHDLWTSRTSSASSSRASWSAAGALLASIGCAPAGGSSAVIPTLQRGTRPPDRGSARRFPVATRPVLRHQSEHPVDERLAVRYGHAEHGLVAVLRDVGTREPAGDDLGVRRRAAQLDGDGFVADPCGVVHDGQWI